MSVGDVASSVPAGTPNDCAAEIENEVPSLDPHGQRTTRSSWQPVDLGPILRGERVASSPGVLAREDGISLLYAERINMFMGETESGKTWAAMVALAQELKADHHAIYVDYEDEAETAVDRLLSLGVTVAQISERFTYIRPDGPFDDLGANHIEAAITQRGRPTLAVIDGVTEAMMLEGLDPTKGPSVASFYGSLPQWLARTGAAVLLIDHVVKNREGRGRWPIGSERKLSGLTGAAYAFDLIRRFARDATGEARITVAKDRCGHVRPHVGARGTVATMTLGPSPDGTVTARLAVPQPKTERSCRPTVLMEKLSCAIAKTPGITTSKLRAEVKGKNAAKDYALELLVAEGYVRVKVGPRGARQHHLRCPFDDSSSEEANAL